MARKSFFMNERVVFMAARTRLETREEFSRLSVLNVLKIHELSLSFRDAYFRHSFTYSFHIEKVKTILDQAIEQWHGKRHLSVWIYFNISIQSIKCLKVKK